MSESTSEMSATGYNPADVQSGPGGFRWGPLTLTRVWTHDGVWRLKITTDRGELIVDVAEDGLIGIAPMVHRGDTRPEPFARRR